MSVHEATVRKKKNTFNCEFEVEALLRFPLSTMDSSLSPAEYETMQKLL